MLRLISAITPCAGARLPPADLLTDFMIFGDPMTPAVGSAMLYLIKTSMDLLNKLLFCIMRTNIGVAVITP